MNAIRDTNAGRPLPQAARIAAKASCRDHVFNQTTLNMAHSPAPWTIHDKPEHKCCYDLQIKDAEGHNVTEAQSDDAALICAAPELLEACKAIMYVAAFTEEAITQEQDDKIRAAFDLVEAAIAKATNPIETT